jgi:hypothetical protein
METVVNALCIQRLLLMWYCVMQTHEMLYIIRMGETCSLHWGYWDDETTNHRIPGGQTSR